MRLGSEPSLDSFEPASEILDCRVVPVRDGAKDPALLQQLARDIRQDDFDGRDATV